MSTIALLLGAMLYGGLGAGDLRAPEPAHTCTPSVLAPKRLGLQQYQTEAPGGTVAWISEASYRLSTGDQGEAWMVVDSDGSGEAGTAPSVVRCSVCAGAAGLVGHEVGKALDEHCD